MVSKNTVLIVFTVIFSIWSISFFIHLYETKDSFKIENIQRKEVSFIIINDRGLRGRKSKSIKNRDRVNMIIKMMVHNSKPVDWNDLNMKATNGLCDIVIYYKTNKSISLNLSNNITSGGIINSGGYYYQNYKLLDYIITILKKGK